MTSENYRCLWQDSQDTEHMNQFKHRIMINKFRPSKIHWCDNLAQPEKILVF